MYVYKSFSLDEVLVGSRRKTPEERGNLERFTKISFT